MQEQGTRYYNKLLVARFSPENKCFVEDGGILIVKPSPPKLIRDHVNHNFIDHFDEKKKSKYGWVKEVEPLTVDQFIAKYVGQTADPQVLDHNKVMLDSIQDLKVDTPVAATYSERTEPQRMDFTVHRVFFQKVAEK